MFIQKNYSILILTLINIRLKIKKKEYNSMNKLLLLISLFINFNLFSQEMNQRTIDSLKVEAVENFQNLYWLNPIKH